jgi:type I restriction enzyme S subunit
MTSVVLSEIASVVRGVSFDKSDVSDSPEDGFVPILRAGNIDGELDLIDDLVWVPGSRVSEEQRMRSGDIAICMSSGSLSVVGKTAALKQEWCGSVGAFCAIIRPDAARIEPDFLAFFLKSDTFRAWTRQSSGANIKNIRKTELEAFEIHLPPLPEQRRIVDLLCRAEGIVRLRREAQRKAAELVPALFLDMFGDPASNPKAWQTVSLSEVSTVGSGAGFPIADQGRDTGDYPFYKVGDMNLPGNEEAMASSRNYIDEATRSRLRATAFPPGAVIFPKIGAAIATNKKRVLSIPSCVDNNVMAVVPSDRLLSSYLHALFMHADLSDFASDSNPPSIRKTTVEAWRIPLPPVDLQRQFAAKVDAVRGIAAQQTAALATAQAAFDALLHQSFAVS